MGERQRAREVGDVSEQDTKVKVYGWAAVVDWYGPYETPDKCADAAEKAHGTDPDRYPDFGVYMATGKLKRWSLMPPKILYIGKNGNSSNMSLAQRIRGNETLRIPSQKTNKVHYWFGLLFGPVQDHRDTRDAENTEAALIHALNPVLCQKNLQRPDYRFGIRNHCPRAEFDASPSRYSKRAFKNLVPDEIEYRPIATVEKKNCMKDLHYVWRSRAGKIRKRLRLCAPEKGFRPRRRNGDLLRAIGMEMIWEPFWAERFVHAVPRIDGKTGIGWSVWIPILLGAGALTRYLGCL